MIKGRNQYFSLTENNFHPVQDSFHPIYRVVVSFDILGFLLTNNSSPFASQCLLGENIKRLTLGNTRPKAMGSRVANFIPQCRPTYFVEFFFLGNGILRFVCHISLGVPILIQFFFNDNCEYEHPYLQLQYLQSHAI